jgi:spore germination protein GerM
MHKTLVSSLRVLMVVVAVVGLLAVSCGSDDGVTTDSTSTTAVDTTSTAPTTTAATTTQAPTTEPTTTTTTTEPTTTTTTTTPDPNLEVVRVYWLRDTGIAVGGREVEMSSLPDSAMAALLEGPNTLETELGMSSAVPAGTEVLGLTIENGVATVDFSSEFETTGMGTAGEIGLVSQVVFTLTQFPTVDAVDIMIEGEARDAILSHGLEATNLTREGFYNAVAPAIVVESPYPGQLVTSPLTVTGFSRTFEATVVYDIVIPPSDLIVDEGFITVAQPDMDQFGLFEFAVDFETDVAGFGAVILFEESAEDGSQINVYEVPVRMEPATG